MTTPGTYTPYDIGDAAEPDDTYVPTLSDAIGGGDDSLFSGDVDDAADYDPQADEAKTEDQ